jgi:hypothetical protein
MYQALVATILLVSNASIYMTTSTLDMRHSFAFILFQYIEEHLRNKRARESLNPCILSGNPCHWCE